MEVSSRSGGRSGADGPHHLKGPGVISVGAQQAAPALLLSELLERSESARRRGDFLRGADFAERAAALADQDGDDANRARALRLLASQQIQLGKAGAAVTTCELAARILQEQDDQAGGCEVTVLQARALSELGLLDEALDLLIDARQTASELDNPWLLMVVHNRIGTVYAQLGQCDRAQEVLLHALDLVETDDQEHRFCVLTNLADNAVHLVPQLRRSGQLLSATRALTAGLRFADRALQLAQASDHPYRISLSLVNLGLLHALDGAHEAATQSIDSAESTARRHGYRGLMLAAAEHRARARLLDGDLEGAIRQFRQVLSEATDFGERPTMMLAHRELSAAYEQVGQYREALQHYRMHHELERAVQSELAATRAQLLAHHFELDKARLETDRLRLETELHLARSRELEAAKRSLEQQTRELDLRVHQDPLTGLWNRRYLDSRLPRLVEAARTSGQDLAFAIADVDFFKTVNDRYGHAVGDEVLRRLGILLRRVARAADFVSRIGGEEFAFTFPHTSLTEATQTCERARTEVEGYDWSAVHPGLRVTISLGVSQLLRDRDHTELIKAADALMYSAKHKGRNRVEGENA